MSLSFWNKPTLASQAKQLYDELFLPDLIYAVAERIRNSSNDQKIFLSSPEELAQKLKLSSVLNNPEKVKNILTKNTPPSARLSNEELSKLILQQSRLGKIFKTIAETGNFAEISADELTFLKEQSDKSIKQFVNQHLAVIDQTLEAQTNASQLSSINRPAPTS